MRSSKLLERDALLGSKRGSRKPSSKIFDRRRPSKVNPWRANYHLVITLATLLITPIANLNDDNRVSSQWLVGAHEQESLGPQNGPRASASASTVCRPIVFQKQVRIHGCVRFNLTLTGCSGNCRSFSMALTEDLRESLANPDQASGSRARMQPARWTMRGPMIEPAGDIIEGGWDERGNNNEISSSIIHLNGDSNNSSSTGEEYLATDELGRSIMKPVEYLKLSNSLIHWWTGLFLHEPNRDLVARDIISVARCCSMDETRQVVVRVLCLNGYRKLMFLEALSCQCEACKALDQ